MTITCITFFSEILDPPLSIENICNWNCPNPVNKQQSKTEQLIIIHSRPAPIFWRHSPCRKWSSQGRISICILRTCSVDLFRIIIPILFLSLFQDFTFMFFFKNHRYFVCLIELFRVSSPWSQFNLELYSNINWRI